VKIPFIQLAPGPDQTRFASQSVSVKLPSQETALKVCTVQVTLGFRFSPILQGKYQVRLQNESAFTTVFVLATPAAEQEFKNQDFPITLNIHDSDAEKPGTVIERDVDFQFPPAYVQRGEIKAIQDPPLPKAKFTLVPVSPENKPPASS
jgi:hypothetical protein